MGVVNPPGIPVNTKRLPPKRKKSPNRIGARKKSPPAHASYAATVIKATYLPVEVTPRTQQSNLKFKGWKVDRVFQYHDLKIQK